MASIKRASSTQLYPHKRDTSSVIRQRHTQTSVPCLSARRGVDLKTPESAHHAAANDYFTYISASQQDPIPEIRLPGNDNSPVIKSSSPINNGTDLLKESVSISMMVDDVCCVLFPTMQEWSQKTVFAKLSALVAVPLVLIFTLTLPVVEGEDIKVDDIEVVAPTPQVVVVPSKSYLTVPTSADDRSVSDIMEDDAGLLMEEEESGNWCRWLVATQAVCATTFVTSVMACKTLHS